MPFQDIWMLVIEGDEVEPEMITKSVAPSRWIAAASGMSPLLIRARMNSRGHLLNGAVASDRHSEPSHALGESRRAAQGKGIVLGR